MRSMIIWGAGGHAKVVADAARLGGWQIVGFLDDIQPDRAGAPYEGSLILGGRDSLDDAAEDVELGFGIGDCRARLTCLDWARQRGRSLPVVAHPQAVVAKSAALGAGVFLAAGAIVNPAAVLGDGVLVNTGATVDHDCRLDDGVHLAPGVNLAGNVTVGARTLVGLGTVVLPGISIGADCIVGAGSVVVRDVPDHSTVYGNPARPKTG
jgi:sugar O-acyltransferase (sialic acid O-acetyltransferase NeuD family)